MRFEEARIFLLSKMENELSADLHYHNINYTKEVLTATEELALMENISGEDLLILKTAALFHDAGFLNTYEGHEKGSCDLARSILPDFAYPPEKIDAVCQLIRSTRIPQTPLDKNAEVLCDADLKFS